MKKILALVLSTLILMSLLCCASAEASWMPKWDRQADVVVVGFGPAGAMAAKAAMDNGATTLILEKESKEQAGGSAITSAGYIGMSDAESFYQSSVGRLTRENAQRLADKSNASVEWLISSGLEVKGGSAVGFGVGYYRAIVKNIEAMGIETLYETPAKELVFDPVTKEVYGVKCITAEGNTLYVKANKGVILCSGGYVANKDLVSRFHFTEPIEYANLSVPGQTGDGLMMALKAGAALDGVTNQQIEWYGLAYKVASEELGTGILHLVDAMAPDSRIFVNSSGKRFMDEEFNFMHSKSDLPIFEYDGQFPNYNGYKNLPMYTIFDSTIYDAGPVGPRDYNCGYASMFNVYNWSENNEAELERGWLVKADTIEELVEKLAEQSGNEMIDAEVLKQTIAEYNAACEAGVDTAFGRDALLLSKLDNPPYYAAELIPGAVYTIGGLQGGENGETLDWDGNPIPRLYHAGDIGQPTMLRVYGFEGAMAAGEIAGEACSKLTSH